MAAASRNTLSLVTSLDWESDRPTPLAGSDLSRNNNTNPHGRDKRHDPSLGMVTRWLASKDWRRTPTQAIKFGAGLHVYVVLDVCSLVRANKKAHDTVLEREKLGPLSRCRKMVEAQRWPLELFEYLLSSMGTRAQQHQQQAGSFKQLAGSINLLQFPI